MTAVTAALRELAGLGATGALHVEAFSGAVVYLLDGMVTHIDAGAAPGIGTVLTGSGRLSNDVWESVLTVGGQTGRVGALLVEQGYLSQGELELCVNGALFDAAYFALTIDPTSVRFVDGERSWFGGELRIEVERLTREVSRRQELLTSVFPSSEFDDAALTLVARLPKDQVVVDALRWELLLNADGRRTPLDLARLLGRGAFATLLEVRRLAAAGLALPPSVTGAAARPAVTPYRPVATGSVAGTAAVRGKIVNGSSSNGVSSAAKPAQALGSALSQLFGPANRKGAAEAVPPVPVSPPPAPAAPPVPPRVPGRVDPPASDRVDPPAPGRAEKTPLPRRMSAPAGPEQPTVARDQPLPPLPRRIPTRVVRPSQQGRDASEPGGEPAPAFGGSSGARWPSPPPEVHAEPPTISSLRRFRDALQGFS